MMEPPVNPERFTGSIGALFKRIAHGACIADARRAAHRPKCYPMGDILLDPEDEGSDWTLTDQDVADAWSR